MVVAVVSSTIVVGLSWIGIPASFVVIATMTIVGLGWGRATRTTRLADAARGEETAVSVGALTAEREGEPARRSARRTSRTSPAPPTCSNPRRPPESW